jgi:hypothetical protein
VYQTINGHGKFMLASILTDLQGEEELGCTAAGLATGQDCKARTSQWTRTAPASGCRTHLRAKPTDMSFSAYEPAMDCRPVLQRYAARASNCSGRAASKLSLSRTGQAQLHDLEQALASVSDEAVLVAEQLLQSFSVTQSLGAQESRSLVIRRPQHHPSPGLESEPRVVNLAHTTL